MCVCVCVCVYFNFSKVPCQTEKFPQKKLKKQTPSTQNLKSPLVKIGPFSDHQKLIFHLILPGGPSDGASAQSPASDEAERLPTTNSAQQRGYGLFRCSSRAAHKLSSSVIATFLRDAPVPSLSLLLLLLLPRSPPHSLPALFAISRSSSSYK